MEPGLNARRPRPIHDAHQLALLIVTGILPREFLVILARRMTRNAMQTYRILRLMPCCAWHSI